jgi:hypothetical protein
MRHVMCSTCHPEDGASRPRDLTTESTATAAERSARRGCPIQVEAVARPIRLPRCARPLRAGHELSRAPNPERSEGPQLGWECSLRRRRASSRSTASELHSAVRSLAPACADAQDDSQLRSCYCARCAQPRTLRLRSGQAASGLHVLCRGGRIRPPRGAKRRMQELTLPAWQW